MRNNSGGHFAFSMVIYSIKKKSQIYNEFPIQNRISVNCISTKKKDSK